MKRKRKVRDDGFLQTGRPRAGRKLTGLLLCICLVVASMPVEYFGVSVQAAEDSKKPELFGQPEEAPMEPEEDADRLGNGQAPPESENPRREEPAEPTEDGGIADISEPTEDDGMADISEPTENPQAENTPELPDASPRALPISGTIQTDTVWTAGTLGDGEVRVDPGVTLTIEGQISISGEVTFQGGGQIVRGTADAYFEVKNGSKLTFGNIVLDGKGISSQYSLIDVKSAGIVTLDDGCVIRNCVKDNTGTAIGGGAVCLEGGTLGCNDAVIEYCSAKNYGGAICARNRSTVKITKGAYRNNQTTLAPAESYAKWGGGFLYALRSSITIWDGNFHENSATGGGGCIFHTGAAGEDLVLDGGIFQGNTSSFPGYEGSGGLWCSSEQIDAGRLKIGQAACFVGTAAASGMDGIYLDRENAVTRKIQLDKPLEYPLTVYLDVTEGYVLAAGTGYTLQQQDAEKILAVDVKNAGKQWYSVLNQGENQIYLSETNPGYGGFDLVQADFYSGGAGQKETQQAVVQNGIGGTVYAPQLKPLEGFRSVGWEENPDGFEGNLSTGAEITLTESKAYYGIYEKEIILDFHADGKNIPKVQKGTCLAKVQEEMIYQYPWFLIPPGPERPGHTFYKWNTKEDGTGTYYEPGSREAFGENVVLYAIWDGGDGTFPDDTPDDPDSGETEIPEGMGRYRVEYYKQEPDGRSYRIAEEDTYYGTERVDTVVKAQEKQFLGFTENTSHPFRRAEGTVTADGELVLKLYYDRNSYAIHFDLNGGGGDAPKARTVRSGSLLAEGSAPVRAGYNFKGWYLDKAGTSGNQWDFGKTPEEHGISESAVLYAKWADETAPVFGKATVTSGYKGLFHWMVQKKGLTVTVPVKEEGSGIKQGKYTVIRKDGSTEEFIVRIRTEQGQPVIQFTLDEDFQGTVVLTCTDHAGNTSAEKVLTVNGIGEVTENNGPEISASVLGGGLTQGTSSLEVTVRDEEDDISGVTYEVDGKKETAAVLEKDAEGDGKSWHFTVQISGNGSHSLAVTAKDRAGNTTVRRFTIEIGGPGADSDTENGGNGGSGSGSNGSGNGGNGGSGGSSGGGSGGNGGSGSGNFGSGGPYGNPSGNGGPGSGGPGGGDGGSGNGGSGGSGGSGGGSGSGTPGSSVPGGGEPRTGEIARVEIYATISMIAGFTYLLLYFTPGIGTMTEEKKELLVHRLVRWAEGKGGLGRLLALAAIFLLLAYYHSIGKALDEEWKTLAGKSAL